MARRTATTIPPNMPPISVSGSDTVEAPDPVAGKLDALRESYNGGESPTEPAQGEKKKRHRRTKAELALARGETESPEQDERAKEQAQVTAKAFASLAGLAMDFFNTRMPHPIPVSEHEKQITGEALEQVLVKYLPQASEYAPELALLGAVAFFAVPRMILPKAEQVTHAEQG